MVNVAEIVKGCKAKNRMAQNHLYELCSPRLFPICLRYTDSREDAHDVLQESMIRIFERIGQLKDNDLLDPWIRRVTVSTAINFYHRQKKHKRSAELDLVMFKVTDQSPDVLSTLGSDELLQLIDSMPSGYKMVFNMFVIEGYSHKEIAEMLRISEGTSKSQFSHAKLWLQQYVLKETSRAAEEYASPTKLLGNL